METYIPRFFQLPDQSCFLFGPRGTGKSTFLRHHLPDALWIDLLKPENYRNFKAWPERLEELVLGNLQQKDVVIDEVQRVPELLPSVSAAWRWVRCRAAGVIKKVTDFENLSLLNFPHFAPKAKRVIYLFQSGACGSANCWGVRDLPA